MTRGYAPTYICPTIRHERLASGRVIDTQRRLVLSRLRILSTIINNLSTGLSTKTRLLPAAKSLRKKKQLRGRCLDAAHGESTSSTTDTCGMHIRCIETQHTSQTDTGSQRRRGSNSASIAYSVQRSRPIVAAARSRHKKQSLGGMTQRGNKQCTTSRLSEGKAELVRALPSKSDDGASRELCRTCSGMTEAQPIQGAARVKTP